MIDQKRCHPQTGGIANANPAADIGIQPNGPVRRALAGHMFDNINGKTADQPYRQQFWLE